jgi:uncharacterized protein (TIGR02679 family)
MAELERLKRLLGGEDLASLRARLRRSLSRGREDDDIVVARLEPHERRTLEGLLGRRTRAAASLRFSVAELDAVFTASGLAGSLREALELLDGPIVDLAAERAQREQAWREVFADVSSAVLTAFLADGAARGLVKRLVRGRPEIAAALLDTASQVLARLPEQGVPRSQLAADCLGDAHGLDTGRPLSSLLMAALRREDESDRETWARSGILVNELAAPALVLNLPAAPDTPLGRLVDRAREQGLPVHLSLRNILRTSPRWLVGARDVFVCENANVVAIVADLLGASAAPLVCTDGMPSASQRTLLGQLAAQGARLHYHGDFDWAGLRIANYVLRTFDAVPWRMGTSDYLGRRGRALTGTPVEASWAPSLRSEMQSAGYALEEEAVAGQLCEDL